MLLPLVTCEEIKFAFCSVLFCTLNNTKEHEDQHDKANDTLASTRTQTRRQETHVSMKMAGENTTVKEMPATNECFTKGS